MPLPLDHIVIAVHDLHTAIDDYHELGFTVMPGGSHPGRSSHNALVVFSDGVYLELIAWTSPEPDRPWWSLLDRFGPGLVDFALLPNTTPQVVAQAQAHGLTYQPIEDGGRLRPDGVELRWQIAHPATPDLPFLCGDITPRTLRVPEGNVREHANGVQGVAQLQVAVQDLSTSLERYGALLGLKSTPIPRDGAVSLQLGRCMLRLETSSTSPAAAARLARQGEGIFALNLHTTQAHLQGTYLQAHTHGVRIGLA